MTNDEMIEWGRKESALRIAEIESCKTQEDLARVQANVKARRKAVGFSSNYAISAMHMATIDDRRKAGVP